MKLLSNLFAVVMIVALFAGAAQAVQVTIVANTATVPDTLNEDSIVQIRGSHAPLTWDGGSDAVMEAIGDDLWETTLDFTAGDTVNFKFYTNAHTEISAGAEWEHAGWEGDVDTGNRILVVGEADTTLPLMFVNGWKAGAGQYEAPWEDVEGTFVVWLRVNMQGWEDFNADAHVVGVRGSNMSDWGQTGELSWGLTHLLTKEENHPNGGSQQYAGRHFYSGAIHVPNEYADAGIKFKVVVHNAGAPLDEDWGNMVYNPGLEMEVPTNGEDQTVRWFWFDNLKPIIAEHADTVYVTFNADMSDAIINKGFQHGDTVLVRLGYYATSAEVGVKQLVRQGFSNVYSATDTIVTTIGERLTYQYYLVKNGIEYREVYYNFYYDGDNLGEAERRIYENIEGGEITVEDVLESQTEAHRMPLFRNVAVVSQEVVLTLTCDIRPAIHQVKAGSVLEDIQSGRNVSEADSILSWGVAVNGPMSGGWGTWGVNLQDEVGRNDMARNMFDDGTHGDAVAGDSVFTIQYTFYPDSGDVVGQEFKFGIGGGDNEGGFGNNHIENIDDTQATATINAQFGSIDPLFYSVWDYDAGKLKSTGVADHATTPLTYELQQNYPNPFNPTTTIQYQLAKAGHVKLTVYNVLGKEIVTLVDTQVGAGAYQAIWDGRNNAGEMVGTGVYFYSIESGDFSQTHKMMLMK